jgi:hypothetical protein
MNLCMKRNQGEEHTMKSKYGLSLLVFVAVLLALSSLTAQATPSGAAQLADLQRKIDAEDPPAKSDARVKELARRFQVRTSRVFDLRTSGMGWGEITIELAMADHLNKMDPQTFPTIGDAMEHIRNLRVQGSGWGAIAQELGFQLGPIISAVKRGRKRFGELKDSTSGENRKTSVVRAQSNQGNGVRKIIQNRIIHQQRSLHLKRIGHPKRLVRPHRPARLGR